MAQKEPQQLELPLSTLAEDAVGLDPAAAEYLYAAACASLTVTGAESPTIFSIDDPTKGTQMARGVWARAEGKRLATFKSQTERTEKAAECIALAALKCSRGLYVLQRAENGSGYDWMVGATSDLEDAVKVEVSGIEDRAPDGRIGQRLRQKLAQILNGAERGFDVHPMLAIVVAITNLVIVVRQQEEEADSGG